jgi:hypothetical protein
VTCDATPKEKNGVTPVKLKVLHLKLRNFKALGLAGGSTWVRRYLIEEDEEKNGGTAV